MDADVSRRDKQPLAPALRVAGLQHTYRRRTKALRDVGFITTGQRTVVLGPNGAGKSTLFAVLSGALRADAGRVTLPGDDTPTSPAQLRRRVGLMAQDIRPVPGLTVVEQVAYAGWLRGLSQPAARRRADELLTEVALHEKRTAKASELSGGQLRRVGLAQALVLQPDLLLLDEPTAGLDPAQRARFRSIIADLPPDLMVLVSTHQVDDIADLYDDVIAINHGQLVFHGTPDEFLAGRSPEQAYLARVEEAHR